MPALGRFVPWRCRLCANTADGELEGIGRLCVDCADDVLERLYALLEVEPIDRRAFAARLPKLGGDDATRPEPVNWRRYLPRTRAERRRQWEAKGLI